MSRNNRTGGEGETVKILFLGQCLQYGYEGVSRYATYPTLAASMLKVRFPGLRFEFDFKYLYHPTGLKALLQHRLLLTKPDIALITLPAMFTATPWRVNLVYQIAPELVDTARTFMRKIEARVKGEDPAVPKTGTIFDKAFAWQPPLTMGEYERIVEEALVRSKQTGSCRYVLMGPGRFNEDTIENYEVHSPEVWSAANQMIMRLAGRLSLPAINAQEALSEYDYNVFIPNNHRFSERGHEIVAREVARVLTSEITMLKHNGI